MSLHNLLLTQETFYSNPPDCINASAPNYSNYALCAICSPLLTDHMNLHREGLM